MQTSPTIPDISPAVVSSASRENIVDPYVGSRSLRWLELLLVLTVAIAQPLYSAIILLIRGPNPSPSISGLGYMFGTVRALTALLLLWYVLKRSGRRFADIGFEWSIQEVAIGILVALAGAAFIFCGTGLIYAIEYAIYHSYMAMPAARNFFPKPSWSSLPYHIVNPFFEELIVRAYLMTEIRALTGSIALAVLISVVVQTSYHLYYGWLGAASIAFIFLAYSLYYARWRRALPTVVAHGLVNLQALLRY
jgi:membrane protease YdiL (CAAX protease family)